MWRSVLVLTLVVAVFPIPALAGEFNAGVAKRDITPEKPTPMWGYGDRHDMLSKGVIDPLYAKAVVLEAGEDKLAIVTLDIGRGPTAAMMARIRPAVSEQAGVDHVLISGSHTHHGPVIELLDTPEQGAARFPDAVAYAKEFERLVIEVIVEAASNTEAARIGWGSAAVKMNRNRQTKIEPKATDPELTVIRIDKAGGDPLAILVNFAAHPTMVPGEDLRFSADYPGHMMEAVEKAFDVQCMFLQGASGDLSANNPEDVMQDKTHRMERFGLALGLDVIKINRDIETSVPENPSLQVVDETFEFKTRIPLDNPATMALLKGAFFSELIEGFREELIGDIIRPVMSTVLINKELAIVGVSGELFCNHANRLKARSRVKTIVQGYCNGHHMYFPTIEAAFEGGYGADSTVSWVPIGAGEQMMDKALVNIYTLLGET